MDADKDVVEVKNFVFFWHGWPGQWYPSVFVGEDGTKYVCAEQWMMAEKARLFKDEDMRKEILATDKPKKMKALGRKVRNFDGEVWDKNARDIVYRGNVLKFSQNPELKQKLIATGDKILAEASPLDKIWGIGLAASDKNARDQKLWKGKNWLGECLMRARETILQLEKEKKDEPQS
eukprot:TRINITY_DN5196_c0_g1_i1.p1 TRINITY_DN5196_c0_g1~~TRINITY_DN5196_c0_g1_i1.p1  ORF type:complete len:177 (+),score=53.57 TRINITY_DN5196_c0_g1_i1:37-567(+)